MKKISLLLAVAVLVLAMAVPALAESIDLGPLGTVTYETSTGDSGAGLHVNWTDPSGNSVDIRLGAGAE